MQTYAITLPGGTVTRVQYTDADAARHGLAQTAPATKPEVPATKAAARPRTKPAPKRTAPKERT